VPAVDVRDLPADVLARTLFVDVGPDASLHLRALRAARAGAARITAVHVEYAPAAFSAQDAVLLCRTLLGERDARGAACVGVYAPGAPDDARAAVSLAVALLLHGAPRVFVARWPAEP